MTDEPTPGGEPAPKRRRRRRRKAAAAAAGAAGRRTLQAHVVEVVQEEDVRRATLQVAGPTREVSAGGVVYRRDGEDVEVVLASRRTRRGDLAWGLAKGGIEPGESHEDAAVREVLEETGYTAEIEASLGDTRYFYVWGIPASARRCTSS